MSHVYRARDTVIDRPVVVKLLTPEACTDTEAKARFLQEARVAGNIQHENIVSVFDFGEHQGRPFIVMEYLKGEDLRGAIHGGRAGSLYERVKVAVQVAEALNYVNSRGVVHRDIKPENIHIDPSGRVKLMDFGIAKTADLSLTRTGMAMGTPYYMSPEQVSGKPTTALMDVYSFGMLLFELITGTRAVNGDSMETVFYQILNVPVDAAALEQAGAPPALRDLVLRCTAKNPAARPQGFGDVILALQAILRGADAEKTQPVAAPPARPGSRTHEELLQAAMARRQASPAGPMIRLSLLTYGSVVLVTVIALVVWWRMHPPQDILGMIYVPGGTFLASGDNHPVKLGAFYIDETEVTNREFAVFCNGPGQEMGCKMSDAASNFPVVNVSYAMAQAYAKSQGKRLPKPLEWERAARGVNGDPYPWGKAEDPALANVANNQNFPVKQLMMARAFLPYHGLYQMVGNAWEMADQEVIPSKAAGDEKPSADTIAHFASLSPPATGDEAWIAIRGGSYRASLSNRILWDAGWIPLRYAAEDIGFRCVKDP